MSNLKSELIVNTAQKLFARFGFNKTTVDEVASLAHIGKSTVYHYFNSKEDIFRAVVKKESQALSQKIRKAIHKASTPQEKLRAYIVTRTKYLNRLVNFYSALKQEYLEHYSFIERIRKKDLQGEIEIVNAILEEGMIKGVFYLEDLELTAFAIATALKGLEYPWAMEVPIPNIEKRIDLLLRVLFNGLVKK